MNRSSTESKTSLALAANLSELELKKILIDKMESNNSYLTLMEILFRLKDVEMMRIKMKNLSLDQTGGSKSKYKTAGESAQTEEPMHTTKDLEEPAHQEFETGVTEDQPNKETPQFPDWFQRPTKLPSPDCDWNKTFPDTHGPVQPRLSSLAQKEYPRESFNELMDTPFDFLAFVMNLLKVDTLTPELLTDPTFELMKGSCQQYPHDLRKPLPLIPNSQGRRVIPFDHFIKNDLEYLSGGVSSQKYATSVTKTNAADYGHIKWIEDLVPNRMWSQVPVSYDKHALWGISHWGRKRQQFYGFDTNRESARDVYSKRRIIAVTKLEIVDWHNYKHLDWITVYRDDDKLYKFKEGDFNRLRIQDIEDMLLLLVQGKLTNLTVKERLAFNVSLRMFTRSAVKPCTPDDCIKVKEFQRSFRHSDTERLSRSDEVLKLKNFKKDATLKLFKSTNQERCSRSHSRQAKEQAQDLKSMITTSNHKLMIEVKDYELKTKVEALSTEQEEIELGGFGRLPIVEDLKVIETKKNKTFKKKNLIENRSITEDVDATEDVLDKNEYFKSLDFEEMKDILRQNLMKCNKLMVDTDYKLKIALSFNLEDKELKKMIEERNNVFLDFFKVKDNNVNLEGEEIDGDKNGNTNENPLEKGHNVETKGEEIGSEEVEGNKDNCEENKGNEEQQETYGESNEMKVRMKQNIMNLRALTILET
ncbi:hypothetical protein Tco_0381195, partial [Tanacetum coccineum]